jgi:hypothetical protein
MHDEDEDLEDEDDLENDILGLSLSDNPQLDDALILRLTYDLATKLHSPASVARRYGLDGTEGLKDYLRDHPEVVAEARKLHAIFKSDAAAEDRVRMKFLHATERLIIPMAGIVADPRTPLGARIDGFKQIQRGAGLDGLSSAARAGQQAGAAGQPFSLVINFAGGRLTGPALPVVINGVGSDGDVDVGDDHLASVDGAEDIDATTSSDDDV